MLCIMISQLHVRELKLFRHDTRLSSLWQQTACRSHLFICANCLCLCSRDSSLKPHGAICTPDMSAASTVPVRPGMLRRTSDTCKPSTRSQVYTQHMLMKVNVAISSCSVLNKLVVQHASCSVQLGSLNMQHLNQAFGCVHPSIYRSVVYGSDGQT